MGGRFAGTATFGSGGAAETLSSVGGYDAFWASYDAQGELAWVAQGGGSGDDQALSVSRVSSGAVFVAGAYQSTLTIGSGVKARSVTSVGKTDAFATRLTQTGDP